MIFTFTVLLNLTKKKKKTIVNNQIMFVSHNHQCLWVIYSLYRATITNLQSRLDATTTSHTLIKEELTLTKMALEKAQEENSILKQDFESNNIFQLLIFLVGHMVLPVSLTCKIKKNKIKDDAGMPQMDSLRTSKRSSTYLASEDAIAEVKMQLAEEKNRRLDLEKELELQTCMRAETEVALKLLEKDIHEKQDTIVSLRRQLDDIKIINLEMYRKMQVLWSFLFY